MALGLAGTSCVGESGSPGLLPGAAPGGPAASSTSPSATASPRAPRAAAQRILDRRARALRRGDLPAFLHDLNRADHAFVRRQRRYFHNLQQLPLGVFDYRVRANTWNTMLYADPRWRETAYLPYVRLSMQLRGFDAVPVRTVYGITFARTGGRLRIVATTDVKDSTRDGVQEKPWDLTRISVRRTDHVLAVFDRLSAQHAGEVVAAVEEGIDSVDRAVPWPWNEHVVVYATGDEDVLDAMDQVPGSDTDNVGALTFPVRASADSARVASRRVLLNPSTLSLPESSVDEVVTHELTHVAVGGRDRGVPVWLAEGAAEYVAHRDDPGDARLLRSVVQRARRGSDGLPSSATFNVVDVPWHYALAWYACDYIARTEGEHALWRLFRAMRHGGRGTPDADQAPVLRRRIGIGPHELAVRAARRIVASYT